MRNSTTNNLRYKRFGFNVASSEMYKVTFTGHMHKNGRAGLRRDKRLVGGGAVGRMPQGPAQWLEMMSAEGVTSMIRGLDNAIAHD